MSRPMSLRELASEIKRLSQLTNTIPSILPPAIGRATATRDVYIEEYNRLNAIKLQLFPQGVEFIAFRGDEPPTTEAMKKANDATLDSNLKKIATIIFKDPTQVAILTNPSIRRKAKLSFYDTMRKVYIDRREAQRPQPPPLVIHPLPLIPPPAEQVPIPPEEPEAKVEEPRLQEEEKKRHQYFDAQGRLDTDILTQVMRVNKVRHPYTWNEKMKSAAFYESYVPPLKEGEEEEMYIDIAERMANGLQVMLNKDPTLIATGVPANLKITYGYKARDGSDQWRTKSFESNVLEIAEMIEKIQLWTQEQHAPESDLQVMYSQIRLYIIMKPEGSCNKSKKDGSRRIGEFHITDRPSKDNNCFFVSARELFEVERVGTVWANTIRNNFGLPNDSPISSDNAIKLLNTYAPTKNWRVWSFDLPLGKHEHVTDDSQAVHEIRLDAEHWTKCEYNPQKKCADCGREFYGTHKCNKKRVAYYQAKVRKYGNPDDAPKYLLPRKEQEANNSDNYLIHFDIETMPDEKRIHQPYAVDYAFRDTYGGHRGNGCMKKFIEDAMKIAAEEPEETFYLNAYNGAKFDVYPLFRELLDMKIPIKHFVVNCGAIIILEFANLKVFDMYKHCQGDLRTNLINAKCNVLKGDIDHDKIASYGSYDNIPEPCGGAEPCGFCKKDIDVYLKADVLGLKELYEKVNAVVFSKYGVNMTSAISTSQLTFMVWTRSLGDNMIQLPTLEQEKDFREAVLGARCYKTRHSYESKEYRDFINGSAKFEDIKDYNAFIDVVSLYPASMAHNNYPIGPCLKMSADMAKNINMDLSGGAEPSRVLPMGIYNIDYKANRNILHAPCGFKDPKTKSLSWNLEDKQNIFRTSVDIENMIKRGYTVKINHGWYWKESAPIFKEYIEELYKVKDKATKDSPEYTLAKLWMNGLYGKMIQRPIYEKTEIVTSNSDYWKFWGSHEITDITEIDGYEGAETPDGRVCRWSVSGISRQGKEQKKCITKPTQLGAFILAYSRRIMMNYMLESNPDDKPQDDWEYTDTDSFCVPARCAQRIKRYNGGTLGDIDDDCGHGAKVLKAVYIAPKLYEIWYALPPGSKMKGGKLAEEHKVYRKFAAKGLEKRDLTSEKFEVMALGGVVTTTKAFTFKKIGLSRNSKQEHIPQFSVVMAKSGHNDIETKALTREANKSTWSGRHFIGNGSVPHGHISI